MSIYLKHKGETSSPTINPAINCFHNRKGWDTRTATRKSWETLFATLFTATGELYRNRVFLLYFQSVSSSKYSIVYLRMGNRLLILFSNKKRSQRALLSFSKSQLHEENHGWNRMSASWTTIHPKQCCPRSNKTCRVGSLVRYKTAISKLILPIWVLLNWYRLSNKVPTHSTWSWKK